jgi:hypothetical protein
VHHHGGSIFPGPELLTAPLFIGLFMLCLGWFLSTFPVVQLWQPMADPEVFESELPLPTESTHA